MIDGFTIFRGSGIVFLLIVRKSAGPIHIHILCAWSRCTEAAISSVLSSVLKYILPDQRSFTQKILYKTTESSTCILMCKLSYECVELRSFLWWWFRCASWNDLSTGLCCLMKFYIMSTDMPPMYMCVCVLSRLLCVTLSHKSCCRSSFFLCLEPKKGPERGNLVNVERNQSGSRIL